MSSFRSRPPESAEVAAAAATVIALESALYGHTAYTASDLEVEWTELDRERDTRVLVDDDGRIVAYGSLQDRGELWRIEGYVHPDAHGRGVGTELVATLEREAAARGARRLQNSVFERDEAAQRLLERRGYEPVRVFRELRIELEDRPRPPAFPDGLRVEPFEPDRDAVAFHAAHQEAFSDHWEYRARDFESWKRFHIDVPTFDASLWCVVRDGDEVAAGTVCADNLFGGGWVSALFTRRAWRGRGVGGGLLRDAFGRFWERGQRSVGLSVDAGSETGAFRVYEREGMTPAIGWVMYEKAVDAAP